MKKILKISFRAIVIVALAFVSIQSNAQIPSPPSGIPGTSGSGTLGNGSPAGGAQVPFDGGMSLVLAASGIGYAAKKLKRKK